MKTALKIIAVFVVLSSLSISAQETREFFWVNPLTEKELKEAPGLSHHVYDSKLVEKKVGYCVFLPPGYEDSESAERRYPVLYMLHGGRPGDESRFVNRLKFIHAAIVSGKMLPSIVVLNNGGPVSHYNVPGRDDCRGKDMLIEELIPMIDDGYRTIAGREGRALQGYSQGGRATARMGFRHPELFSQLVIGSAGATTEKRIQDTSGKESATLVFAPGDDMWTYATTYAKKYRTQYSIEIFVHVGDAADFNYQGNLEYDAFLSELGLRHEFVIVPGQKHGGQAYDRLHGRIIAFQNKAFEQSLNR